jgi:hypothetical protein
MADMSAASGRPALALTRDTDWEDVVRAVHSLPMLAEHEGLEVAVAWCDTELRSVVDLLSLAQSRTAANAKAVHRIHMALSEGPARVMCRSDRAGFNCRVAFLRAVERWMLGPTLREVFARTAADARSAYQPIVGENR